MRPWFLLVFGLLALPLPAAAQGIGSVEAVTSVAYATPPAGRRDTIVLRRSVVQNERVETAPDAAVGLRFIDDTVFRVGPDSSVLLDTYVFDAQAGAGTLALALAKGSFRFVTGRMAKTGVQLVTPTITLGVRGTDFAVLVYPTGVTDIFVFEGSVDVRPLNLAIGTLLAAGQYGRAASAAGPVQIFGPPPSDARGFIGIAEVDRRIAGARTDPGQPLTPEQPFFNPIPATPVPVPAQPAPPPMRSITMPPTITSPLQ